MYENGHVGSVNLLPMTQLLTFQVQHGLFHGPLCPLHRFFHPSSIAWSHRISWDTEHSMGHGSTMDWYGIAMAPYGLPTLPTLRTRSISLQFSTILSPVKRSRVESSTLKTIRFKSINRCNMMQPTSDTSDSALFHQKKSGLLESVCAGAKAFLILSQRHIAIPTPTMAA